MGKKDMLKKKLEQPSKKTRHSMDLRRSLGRKSVGDTTAINLTNFEQSGIDSSLGLTDNSANLNITQRDDPYWYKNLPSFTTGPAIADTEILLRHAKSNDSSSAVVESLVETSSDPILTNLDEEHLKELANHSLKTYASSLLGPLRGNKTLHAVAFGGDFPRPGKSSNSRTTPEQGVGKRTKDKSSAKGSGTSDKVFKKPTKPVKPNPKNELSAASSSLELSEEESPAIRRRKIFKRRNKKTPVHDDDLIANAFAAAFYDQNEPENDDSKKRNRQESVDLSTSTDEDTVHVKRPKFTKSGARKSTNYRLNPFDAAFYDQNEPQNDNSKNSKKKIRQESVDLSTDEDTVPVKRPKLTGRNARKSTNDTENPFSAAFYDQNESLKDISKNSKSKYGEKSLDASIKEKEYVELNRSRSSRNGKNPVVVKEVPTNNSPEKISGGLKGRNREESVDLSTDEDTVPVKRPKLTGRNARKSTNDIENPFVAAFYDQNESLKDISNSKYGEKSLDASTKEKDHVELDRSRSSRNGKNPVVEKEVPTNDSPEKISEGLKGKNREESVDLSTDEDTVPVKRPKLTGRNARKSTNDIENPFVAAFYDQNESLKDISNSKYGEKSLDASTKEKDHVELDRSRSSRNGKNPVVEKEVPTNDSPEKISEGLKGKNREESVDLSTDEDTVPVKRPKLTGRNARKSTNDTENPFAAAFYDRNESLKDISKNSKNKCGEKSLDASIKEKEYVELNRSRSSRNGKNPVVEKDVPTNDSPEKISEGLKGKNREESVDMSTDEDTVPVKRPQLSGRSARKSFNDIKNPFAGAFYDQNESLKDISKNSKNKYGENSLDASTKEKEYVELNRSRSSRNGKNPVVEKEVPTNNSPEKISEDFDGSYTNSKRTKRTRTDARKSVNDKEAPLADAFDEFSSSETNIDRNSSISATKILQPSNLLISKKVSKFYTLSEEDNSQQLSNRKAVKSVDDDLPSSEFTIDEANDLFKRPLSPRNSPKDKGSPATIVSESASTPPSSAGALNRKAQNLHHKMILMNTESELSKSASQQQDLEDWTENPFVDVKDLSSGDSRVSKQSTSTRSSERGEMHEVQESGASTENPYVEPRNLPSSSTVPSIAMGMTALHGQHSAPYTEKIKVGGTELTREQIREALERNRQAYPEQAKMLKLKTYGEKPADPIPKPKPKPKKPVNVNDPFYDPVTGKIYRKPRLLKPKKWVTDKMYKHIQKCLEPKFGRRTRIESEDFVKFLCESVTTVIRRRKATRMLAKSLFKRMLKLNIVNTLFEFHLFIEDYLPYEFRIKVIPGLGEGEPKPLVPDYDADARKLLSVDDGTD